MATLMAMPGGDTSGSERRRRGRRRRGSATAQVYAVRLTPDERARLEAAARANHQRPADFARDALVTAADDILEGGDSAIS